VKNGQIKQSIFGKLIKFNSEQLQDAMFAINCIEQGVETSNTRALRYCTENQRLKSENEKLRLALNILARHKQRLEGVEGLEGLQSEGLHEV
jgi:regulator of replication initiation timing